MFGLQPWHVIAILAIALLVFGPSRLPEIGQAIGKSIREFRDAATATQESFREGIEAKPAEAQTVSKQEQDRTDGQSKT